MAQADDEEPDLDELQKSIPSWRFDRHPDGTLIAYGPKDVHEPTDAERREGKQVE